jgi:DNA-binding NarL/FixJ family response regulator
MAGERVKKPRVVIADDHVLLLDAFERLLEGTYEIVGKAVDGRGLVRAALELKPDAVVADVSMPELNGLEAARRILAQLPRTRVVLLTVHEDEVLAADALSAGVSGFVVKRSAAGELQQALRDALAGRTYLTPLVAADAARLAPGAAAENSLVGRLTAREREVLQLLAEGRTMKEIGARLGITARTVAFHKYQLAGKLGLQSAAELVRFAIEHHLA